MSECAKCGKKMKFWQGYESGEKSWCSACWGEDDKPFKKTKDKKKSATKEPKKKMAWWKIIGVIVLILLIFNWMDKENEKECVKECEYEYEYCTQNAILNEFSDLRILEIEECQYNLEDCKEVCKGNF